MKANRTRGSAISKSIKSMLILRMKMSSVRYCNEYRRVSASGAMYIKEIYFPDVPLKDWLNDVQIVRKSMMDFGNIYNDRVDFLVRLPIERRTIIYAQANK